MRNSYLDGFFCYFNLNFHRIRFLSHLHSSHFAFLVRHSSNTMNSYCHTILVIICAWKRVCNRTFRLCVIMWQFNWFVIKKQSFQLLLFSAISVFPLAFCCCCSISNIVFHMLFKTLDLNGKVKMDWFFFSFDTVMWPEEWNASISVLTALWKNVPFGCHMPSTTFRMCVVRCHVCTLIFIYTFIIKIESLEWRKTWAQKNVNKIKSWVYRPCWIQIHV